MNLGVLASLGYVSYKNWNQPWDRRVVAGVVAGLFALTNVEG